MKTVDSEFAAWTFTGIGILLAFVILSGLKRSLTRPARMARTASAMSVMVGFSFAGNRDARWQLFAAVAFAAVALLGYCIGIARSRRR